MSNFKKLANIFGKSCKINEPMASYTTLRIGGPAALFIEAKSEKELVSLIKLAFNRKVPYFILAGGSNILVSDSGYKGLVIHPNFTGIKIPERIDMVYLSSKREGIKLFHSVWKGKFKPSNWRN